MSIYVKLLETIILKERNVYNTTEIKNLLSQFLPRINTDNTKKWFINQSFKYIINDYNNQRDISIINSSKIPNPPAWIKPNTEFLVIKVGGKLQHVIMEVIGTIYTDNKKLFNSYNKKYKMRLF